MVRTDIYKVEIEGFPADTRIFMSQTKDNYMDSHDYALKHRKRLDQLELYDNNVTMYLDGRYHYTWRSKVLYPAPWEKPAPKGGHPYENILRHRLNLLLRNEQRRVLKHEIQG